MALENKLHIEDPAALARAEEKISKTRALDLFETGLLDKLDVGTFAGLQQIHAYLFGDIYDFAGKLRTVNMAAKGNFRFAPVMYLEVAPQHIDNMPQSTFDEIVERVPNLYNRDDPKRIKHLHAGAFVYYENHRIRLHGKHLPQSYGGGDVPRAAGEGRDP